MGTLNESPVWEAGVRHFEANAVLTGGPDCPDNLPLSDLANRTAWLKQQIESAQNGLAGHEAATDPHPQYLTSAEGDAKINAHLAAADPHPQYATDVDLTNHGAAADPHPAYWNNVRGDAKIAAAIAALVNSSPATLDTLAELATALGNDPNFATTITNSLATKATQAGVQGQTYTAFTTTGAPGAFVLTPIPAIAAYAAGQRFRVKFHAAGNGADTVAVSGLAAKGLKQYDSTGAKVAAVIAANQLVDVEYDGVDIVLLDPLPPTVSVGLPRRYLSGLQTAINAGRPTTKIDIGAGKCRSDDDSVDIVIAATLTKQLTAAWAAGNKGGLDTGAVAANTGYHVFAIYNPTTTVSDVLFSTSYAAPTMPGGFTKKRWIGWIRTDGSSLIKPYFQRGDIFMWNTPGLDVNGSALSAGAGANYALPVPSGLVVQAMVNVQCSGPDAGCYVHSPETDAMYPATTPTTTPPLSMLSWTSSNPEMSAGSLIIPTDTSASIRVDSTSSWTETIYIGTLGWISARGRND